MADPPYETDEFRVIVSAPRGRDAKLIVDLLQKSSIVSQACPEIREVCAALADGAGAAIIAEEALTTSIIEELAVTLKRQPPWSDFPVILLTTAGEVTRFSQKKRSLREPLGNVLLLERPVRPETLIGTVQNALRSRKRQYELRERLHQFEQAQEALRKSEKLAVTGRLAASIAHEINNPLESVTNLLYLLRDADQGEHDAFLQKAEHELARVTEITKQTLRFYREPSRPFPVNVVDVLESVLLFYKSRIIDCGITVKKDLSATLPVLAAEGEIRQVFSNIVVNALDAMRHGGLMILRARDAIDPVGGRRGVRISVADTGSGIPEVIRKKIFEPFVSTKGDMGTGLGLWVTSEIVHKLEGRIAVKSRACGSGSGTVFSIFWPVTDKFLAEDGAELKNYSGV